MPTTIIIAIIAIFIISSFIISGVSYSRQQALKKRKLMIKRFHQQADEALSYIPLLLRFDPEYDLIIHLQNLIIKALTNAFKLNPQDKMIINNLNTQKIKLNEYQENQRSNQPCYWLASDSELLAIQTQLAHLNKLLDLYRNKGDLSFSKHQEFQNRIHTIQQDLSINSYLFQADLFAEQNNITSYQLFIKQAIQSIKKSTIETNHKNSRIKELSDRIQEVKRTGQIGDLKNLIKPVDNTATEQDTLTNPEVAE